MKLAQQLKTSEVKVEQPTPIVNESEVEHRKGKTWSVTLKIGPFPVPIEFWNGIQDSDEGFYENTKTLCQNCLLEDKKVPLQTVRESFCPKCNNRYTDLRNLPRGIVDKAGNVLEVLTKEATTEPKIEETTILYIPGVPYKYLDKVYFVTSPEPVVLKDLAHALILCYNLEADGKCSLNGSQCQHSQTSLIEQLTCQKYQPRSIVIHNVKFKVTSKPRDMVLLLDKDGELIGKELVPKNLLRLPVEGAKRVQISLDEIKVLDDREKQFISFLNVYGKKVEGEILSTVKTKGDKLKKFGTTVPTSHESLLDWAAKEMEKK